MKYLKFVFSVVLSVCLLFSSFQFLDAYNYDLLDALGITEEDFDFLEENGYVIFTPVSLFSDSSDFIVEEIIKLTTSPIQVNQVNVNGSEQSNLDFGELIVIGNSPQLLQFTLDNSGGLLFENPGTFNLSLSLLAGNVTVTTVRNGVSSYESLGSFDDITEITYSIDNSNADLEKVQIKLTDGVTLSYGGPYLRGGILKYGYILDEVEESEPVPEPEPVVPGDTSGVITYLLDFITMVLSSIFLYEIVSGVTFGYFILTIAILSIIFKFLFKNLIE